MIVPRVRLASGTMKNQPACSRPLPAVASRCPDCGLAQRAGCRRAAGLGSLGHFGRAVEEGASLGSSDSLPNLALQQTPNAGSKRSWYRSGVGLRGQPLAGSAFGAAELQVVGRRRPSMTEDELVTMIEEQRALMVAVSTGGPRIQEVNPQYIERRGRIGAELKRRGLEDPNPHGDLWQWYGRWSQGDMPSWASRRAHLAEMYQPLVDQIRAGPSATGAEVFEEPTGWPRVDRGIYELRRRLEQADNEEQFQAVGLLCRETLISAAQVVYDAQRHPSPDGVEPSATDAKRMLDAYVAAELAGGPNEAIRRHAKAALSLAVELQHHRIADYRQAALCAEATTSVVNLIAIISGRRDREG